MKTAPLSDALRMTKALADGQRIRALMLLRDGELCVCQLVAVLRLAASTVSRHLSILAGAGLVELRREGRWAYYRAARPGRALRWMRDAVAADAQIRADREMLRRVKQQSMEVLCRQQRPR